MTNRLPRRVAGAIGTVLFGSAFLVAGAVTGSAQTATTEPASTPTLSAQFSPGTITAGAVSRLTFGIDNPATSSAVSDLTFSATLPNGLTVAQQPATSTTCTEGTVVAAGGSSTIALSNGTVPASASCGVSVNVSASASGTFIAQTSPLSSNTEAIAAAASSTTGVGARATLVVQAQSNQVQPAAVGDPITFTKSFNPTTVAAGGTATLTFTLDNTANATETTGLGFIDTLPTTPGAMTVAAIPNKQPGTDCDAAILDAVTAQPNAATITLTNGRVPAGKLCTFSIDVTVAATPTEGSYANTVDITPSQRSNGTATATLVVSATAGTATTLPITTATTIASAAIPAPQLATTGTAQASVLTVIGFVLLVVGSALVVAARRHLLRS